MFSASGEAPSGQAPFRNVAGRRHFSDASELEDGTDELQPGIGDELVSGGRGMDAVGGPEGLRGAFEGLVEDILSREMEGVEFLGELGDDLASGGDVGDEFRAVGHIGADKGIHEDEADVGKLLARPLEKLAVDALVAGYLDAIGGVEFMPGVVDADEDADDVGAEVDGVDFPARVEVDDAVAGDAAVDDVPVLLRCVAEESGGDEERIAGAESVAVVAGGAGDVASAVSDGVALE